MTLASDLRKSGATSPKQRTTPVWGGPEKDGITFSLLSRFLCCRERFRLLVVEGLKPVDQFNHRIHYGQMWHRCEEGLAAESKGAVVLAPMFKYCQEMMKQYRTAGEQIDHWYNVCKTQFPIYVDYWSKHPDVKDRIPLLQEQVFNVPYKLPSGRIVRLRGKWDSVDLIGKGKEAGIYLQENKTKGDVDEQQLKRQLSFDLQTMMYLVALGEHLYLSDFKMFGKGGEIQHAKMIKMKDGPVPILGVRYNVIRRPLSGGKGSIRQHQATKSNPAGESKAEFYARLGGIIKAESETYFMRWKVGISQDDIAKFRQQCLDPILEQLCDWWAYIVHQQIAKLDPWTQSVNDTHYRSPYGVFDVLKEGGSSELDEYLANGSEVGLQRSEELFPELKE